MSISTDILNRARRGFVVFDDLSQLSHRTMIIQRCCDIEAALAGLITRLVVRQNPAAPMDALDGLLFREGGPLGAPKRQADFCFALGLIDTATQHDVKVVADMRDRYAHDRYRLQLGTDPDMLKKLHSLKIWQDNSAALSSMDPQSAFVAITDHLIRFIAERLPDAASDR